MSAFDLYWLEAGHWDLFVAIYLFLGGISGGAYMVSYLAEFAGKRTSREGYYHVARWGLITSFVTIAVGSMTLLLHLSGPLFRAFMFPVLFTNMSSWMAIGTWVIVLFTLLVLVRLLWAMFGSKATDDPSGFPRRLVAYVGLEGLLDRIADRTRPSETITFAFGGVIALLAVALVVYTALLLSDVGWNVPLWNPTLLPLLFLASGFSAGIATTVMISHLVSGIDGHLVHKFSLLDDGVIIVELVVLAILLYVLSSGAIAEAATYANLSDNYGLLLWVGVIGFGLVMPLLISVGQQVVGRFYDENWLMTKQVCSVKFGLVVLGAFMLRFLVIAAAVKTPLAIG